MVVTTAGGWGVVTADAVTADRDLVLMPLPADLQAAVNELLPPRWSNNNPIDLAGAETRDTIPDVLELAAAHPDVDAIVYLGLGIQSNQAKLMRNGGFYPGFGLDRIVEFHERQDVRYAEVADEVSRSTGKPILTATELAVADRDNPGPATVRRTGRLCYASANRAVTALGHLYRYARYRTPPRAVLTRRRSTAPAVAVGVLVGVLALVPPALLAQVATDAGRKARTRRGPPSTAAPRSPGAVATPLLSARRVPGIVTGQLKTTALLDALGALGQRVDSTSCLRRRSRRPVGVRGR